MCDLRSADLQPHGLIKLSFGIGGATFGAGLLLLMLDQLLQRLLPPTIQPLPVGVALWKRLQAAYYSGITEELLLRLFLMTLIAWGIWRTAYKAQLPPDATVFRAAIVAAAGRSALRTCPRRHSSGC